jgi:hypothetical protein
LTLSGADFVTGSAISQAIPGKTPPKPASFFPSVLARWAGAKPEGKKVEITWGSQPRAALSLPGAIITSSLRDFGLARWARRIGERQSSGVPMNYIKGFFYGLSPPTPTTPLMFDRMTT